MNKSENTLLNEPSNTARLTADAKANIPPLEIKNEIETVKEDQMKTTIFDFFKTNLNDLAQAKTQDTNRTQKSDTFDG